MKSLHYVEKGKQLGTTVTDKDYMYGESGKAIPVTGREGP
jgi:hypothetical protein